MKRVRVTVFTFMMIFGSLTACATSGSGDAVTARAQIEARVQEFLKAYADDDQDAVLRMVDNGGFSVYGSDISEFVESSAELKQMMSDDFTLWGSAKFGTVKSMDIRVGGHLATAIFNVPFSAGGRPDVMVRVTTVWRQVDGVWLLTQSANSVPTVGSSAHDLIKH